MSCPPIVHGDAGDHCAPAVAVEPLRVRKFAHLDAVVQPGFAAARDDLQPGGPAPFRGEPLHRTGGQIKARLKSRQTDVGRIQVPDGVIGLPAAIEGHAALAQRHDAALSLLGLTLVGTPDARGGVERPGAVGGRLPLRLGDDAVLRERARRAAFVRTQPARHGVDLQRMRQSLRVLGAVVTRGNIGRQ